MTSLVDRLEQLAAEATPGPWDVRSVLTSVAWGNSTAEMHTTSHPADAALIVELRNSLPALLTALRAAHDVRETWRRKGLSASGCYAQAEALAEALAPLFGEDTTP